MTIKGEQTMHIDRKEFVSALKLAMPGIGSGTSVLEGADTFIFDDGYIHSFNDAISVSVPFVLLNKQKEPVSGALKAKDLFDLLNRFGDDTITFIPKEGFWVFLSGNSKAELTLLESGLNDRIHNLFSEKLDWIDLPETFMKGVSICQLSNNTSQLAGTFVKDNVVMSTDTTRIGWYDMGASIDNSFWISDQASKELLKLVNPRQLSISKSWVHFKTEAGAIFSCKQIAQANYPVDKIGTLLKVHKKEKGDLYNEFPTGLADAVNRAAALAGNIEGHDTIRLTFDKDGVEVFSQRTSGKFTEIIPWEKPFKDEMAPISIFMDYAMLINVIRYSNQFYMKKIMVRDTELVRMMFTYESGIQLISTFAEGT
jgi:hypothetical protein